MFPYTSSFSSGVVVPIPTLPPLVARYVEPVVVSCVVLAPPEKVKCVEVALLGNG